MKKTYIIKTRYYNNVKIESYVTRKEWERAIMDTARLEPGSKGFGESFETDGEENYDSEEEAEEFNNPINNLSI